MAENESAVAEQQQEEDFVYPIRIEDAGPGTKKVSVEIPREKIDSEMEKQFKELRQQAAIPGFRPGHAPQKLIEKRFSSDVKEQVRRSLISESYEQAVEKNKLQVIGEPEFDDPDAIKLPEQGPLSYSFTVEVRPEFTLPDVSNLKVRKPKIEIRDENVDQAMRNLREQQGALVPVEDRGVQEGDYLFADVHIKVDGNVIAHEHDTQLVSRSGKLVGIQVDDLPQQLAEMKPGETRTITAHAPDTHPGEALRGKDVQIEITLKDIKHLELAEINQAFMEDLGFENEQELRDALREQMEQKISDDIQHAMREQVNRYLLENTQFELPERLSTKQADRVVSRRAVNLMMRGVPREQVEANIEQLRGGAQEEAVRELKLFFILQKLAEQQGVDVDEAELNGRIAMLAAQRDERPERLKQEMSKDGTLLNMYLQLREEKAIDKVLAQAQVEEVNVEEGQKKE
ncbi:MAG TPA: trigger factor [Tepidisphaeraceae bacterium]|nr:trigger factor [Tepidisphaeraceae bacterium]